MNADERIGPPSPDEVDLAVEVFRMLADPTRLTLLWCLRDGEMSVGELAEAAGKSATSVSQHLAKLRLARLVHTWRDGNTIHYRLDSDHARQMVLDGIYHAQHQGDVVPEHHRESSVVKLASRVDA